MQAFAFSSESRAYRIYVTRNTHTVITKLTPTRFFSRANRNLVSVSKSLFSSLSLPLQHQIQTAITSFNTTHKKPATTTAILAVQTYFGGVTLPIYGELLAINNGVESSLFFLYKGAIYDENGVSIEGSSVVLPVTFSRISDYFSASRLHPILKIIRPHYGVDFVAPRFTPVKSVMSGVITSCGYNIDMGNYVRIRHANGLESIYGHLATVSQAIRFGTQVKAGEIIGSVGSSGLSTGPHLFFALRQGDTYIDPARLFAKRHVETADAGFVPYRNETKIHFQTFIHRR